MHIHRRLLVAAISAAALTAACSDDSSTSGTAGSGGEGAGQSTGGGDVGGGGTDATHEAWSLTEAFSVPTPAVQVHALSVADDGHAYVAGFGESSPRVVARHAPDGAVVDGWPVEPATPAVPSGLGFFVTALADGSLGTAVPGTTEWVLSRYDASGSQLWTASYPLAQNEYGMSLVPTADGGLALVTTVVNGGPTERCSVAAFDGSGVARPVYTAPNDDADANQIVRCIAAGTDAATGDIVLLGEAATTVPWTGAPAPRPAFHRVSADFSTASTIRDGFTGNTLGGSFSNGSTSSGHNLVVRDDGTLFAAGWTNGYAPDLHPTSLLARVGATSHDRWYAAQARMTPLGEAPFAAFAHQDIPSAPVSVSIVDTSYDEPFALATTSFDPGSEGMLVDARVAGQAVLVLWHGEDAEGVRRAMLTRYDAATSTAEGPAPAPAEPELTHDVNELTSVDATGSLFSSPTIVRFEAAPDGGLYVLGRDNAGNWTVDRLDADGASVGGSWPYAFTFPSFPPTQNTAASPNMAVLADSSLIVTHLGQFGWVTKHLSGDGTQDWEAEYDSGAEDYPAGVVIDAQGRVVVFGSPGTTLGTPHVDCHAVRYSAAGAFDDTFEIAVTTDSSPTITHCRAGVLDALTGDVALLGTSIVDHPGLGQKPDRALARLSEGGVVLPSDTGEAGLFGPILNVSAVGQAEVGQGHFVALSDGTLVANLTGAQGGYAPNRVAAVGPNGTTVFRASWEVGERHLSATDGDHVVTTHQQSVFHPIELEVSRVTANSFEPVASHTLSTAAGWGQVVALSAGPSDTFWVLIDSQGSLALERYSVTAK